jgi:eukaryotic-like serine/threonine-protein kinase
MDDELEQLLRELNEADVGARYVVDEVLKDVGYERTELVHRSHGLRTSIAGSIGNDIDRTGSDAANAPLIRKTISLDAGIGLAYETIFRAQAEGRTFRHLPRLFNCERQGGQLIVVMEYLSGPTFAQEIETRGPSAALARRLFPLACDAAAELHESFEQPVIHRDIKPSNIILAGDSPSSPKHGERPTGSSSTSGHPAGERAYLIDLGIARTYNDEASADTKRFGTRAYAPPEQFGYSQTDVRSDVYALGMLLFHLLTGATPDPSLAGNAFARANVPDDFRDVLTKATAFNPDDRYQTVRDLKQAFMQAAFECGTPASNEPNNCATDITTSGVANDVGPGQTRLANPMPPSALARLKQGARTLLAKIPRPLGLAWNTALAIYSLFLICVCVDCAFNPPAGNEFMMGMPIAVRLITYAFAGAIGCSPALLLFDRRPLYRLLPKLKTTSLPRQYLAIAGVLLICAAGIAIVGAFAQ